MPKPRCLRCPKQFPKRVRAAHDKMFRFPLEVAQPLLHNHQCPKAVFGVHAQVSCTNTCIHTCIPQTREIKAWLFQMGGGLCHMLGSLTTNNLLPHTDLIIFPIIVSLCTSFLIKSECLDQGRILVRLR